MNGGIYTAIGWHVKNLDQGAATIACRDSPECRELKVRAKLLSVRYGTMCIEAFCSPFDRTSSQKYRSTRHATQISTDDMCTTTKLDSRGA